MDNLMIALSYNIPSLILYFLVISTIIKRRKQFSGAFYTLFLTSSTIVSMVETKRETPKKVDILCVINVFFGIRIPAALTPGMWLYNVYMKIPEVVVNFSNFWSFHFSFLQFSMISMISMNRLTAIKLPMEHDRIWSKITPYCIIFVLVFPLYATLPFATTKSFFAYMGPQSGNLVLTTDVDTHTVFLKLVVFHSICSSFTVMINILSVMLICKYRKSLGKKTELNMFCLSFVNCCLLVIVASFVVFEFLQADDKNREGSLAQIIMGLLPWVADIFTYANAYLIFFLNTSVRKEITLWILSFFFSSSAARYQTNRVQDTSQEQQS